MEENINYSEAFDELKLLVTQIESGEISIDDLAEKVKRASHLIKLCKSKLTSTEENVKQILEDLSATEDEV